MRLLGCDGGIMVAQQEILLTELAARERLLHYQRIATHQAETLLQIMDALHGHGDLSRGLEQVLQICRCAMGADLAVLLRRSGSEEMETILTSDPEFGLPVWPLGEQDLLRPLCITDIRETPLAKRVPKQALAYRALLSVPLGRDPDPGMAVALFSRRMASFAAPDQALMQRIGAVLGRTVQNRQLSQRNAVLTAIIEGASGPNVVADTGDPSFDALGRAFDRLADWQNRILHLTNDLLIAPVHALDTAIDRTLAQIGQLVASDRTYVFRLTTPDLLSNTHEWVAPGIEPMQAMLQDVPVEVMGDWRAEFDRGSPVSIPDVDALPVHSSTREILQMQGILSLLVVPMRRDGVLTGFVGIDFVRGHRHFLLAEIRLLQSVANTISAAVDRRAAEAMALKAQASLAQERDRLKATLAALPDLMLELDQDGRFTGYNFGGGTSPAYLPEAFLGRLVEEVLPPDLAAVAREVMCRVDTMGPHPGHEYPMMTDEGERWYAVSAGALRNSGRSNGYVFLIRDVTDRHQKERQIRRLSRIAELTSNLVVITDPEGQIDWVNPAFEARTGWPLDEVRGRKPGHFLQFEGTDPATIGRIGRALAKGKPVRSEILNRSRSGAEYWVSKDIQPLTDTQGRLEGFVAVQTDITALKKAHQRELHLRATAIESSMDGIAISDENGRYVYMNATHRRLFGIGPGEDIRSISWADLTGPETQLQVQREAWPLLESEGRWQGELTGQRRDGVAVNLDITLTLTEIGDLVCIARDITEKHRLEAERMRMREQLQLAQRRETVAHVASGVAHDLNNLIAVVSGTVTLLQCNGQVDTHVPAGLRRIARAMDAAGDLVHGLGHLGRPDAPKGPLDLRKLVLEAIDLLGSERTRRHTVHAELPAVEQLVWANRTELLQVIVNLALNACEAGGDGQNQVTLTVTPEDCLAPERAPDAGDLNRAATYRIFRVRDTGEGVDPASRARLFERYMTTKGQSGTGLGLPIVATILRDNEGALWFDSVPGAGTVVTVAWPNGARHHPAAIEQPARPDTPPSDLSGHHILVVDDNIDVAEVLSSLIEARGAIAISVTDPDEAVDLIRSDPGLWSAVVTDFDMPVVNGAQLAQAALGCNPPVPCILVTALPRNSGWDTSLFRDVHPKPVDPESFIKSLSAVVAATPRR